MPGAKANGILAHNAMTRVPMIAANAVVVNSAPLSIPVADGGEGSVDSFLTSHDFGVYFHCLGIEPEPFFPHRRLSVLKERILTAKSQNAHMYLYCLSVDEQPCVAEFGRVFQLDGIS